MIIPDSFRRTVAILGACIVLAAAFGWYTLDRSTSPDVRARAIVAECAKSGTDHSPCYESVVPGLYPELSVPQVFAVVRDILTQDSSYQFCHVLAHKLGERVVESNPSAWLNAIPLNPTDGLCSNGFIHGVVGGRFRSEVLDDATIQKTLPDFREACLPHGGWQPSDLDRAICYHGVGHLFVFITNADIPKALSLCDAVAPDDYRRVCVQGVFMQIYQPLEPDDYELIAQMPVKPSTTTVPLYCSRYAADPMAQGSCIEESWPYAQPHITDGTAVERLCAQEPNAVEEDFCYAAMSAIVGRMSLGDERKALDACKAFPRERQATCFSHSAEAILEENRDDVRAAVDFCKTVPSAAQDSCLAFLIDRAPWMYGSDTKRIGAFCAALPASLQDACARTAGA